MTDTLPGKRYGAMQAWPDATAAGRWRYLALSPTPQRNDAGRAQVTVMDVGDMLMLTLGTALSPTVAEFAATQAAIAADAGVATDQIDLRPADATATEAALVLIDGTAETVLATAKPSSVGAYSTAFSAMLTGDTARAVKAALQGQGGRLVVRYHLDLPRQRAATATLRGDWSAADDIDAALATGDLTLSVTADVGASEALKAEARTRVIDQAAQMLARLAPGPAAKSDAGTSAPDGAQPDTRTETETRQTADLDVSVTRTETVARPLRLESDVAEWMK